MESETPAQKLAEGQLWKLRNRYVYIVGLGKDLIRFKLLDSPKETGERILTSGIDTLWGYLTSRKGKLVSAEFHC
jgi:hypothetical protein